MLFLFALDKTELLLFSEIGILGNLVLLSSKCKGTDCDSIFIVFWLGLCFKTGKFPWSSKFLDLVSVLAVLRNEYLFYSRSFCNFPTKSAWRYKSSGI